MNNVIREVKLKNVLDKIDTLEGQRTVDLLNKRPFTREKDLIALTSEYYSLLNPIDPTQRGKRCIK